jgi:hypothetical protein
MTKRYRWIHDHIDIPPDEKRALRTPTLRVAWCKSNSSKLATRNTYDLTSYMKYGTSQLYWHIHEMLQTYPLTGHLSLLC